MPGISGMALGMRRPIIIALAPFMVAGCDKPIDVASPPRSETEPDMTAQTSTFAMPLEMSIAGLQGAVEKATPKTLWSIDERRDKCVSGQRIKAFGANIKVTPDLGCRIVGKVTRGRMRVTAAGRRLMIAMPVSAVISARDVGGVIKRETATGSATVRADVRLGLDRNWNPTAKVNISYGWREPPGIDFLGQRIRFVERADRELAGVIAGLERELQREISRQSIRPIIADGWRQAFTVESLNRRNPPAWMRITPKGLALADLHIAGDTATMLVAAEMINETYIGEEKPERPDPTPLPPQMATVPRQGFNANLPVLADYRELEKVVLRELRELDDRGITLPNVGRVSADFRTVEIYGTENGRLAVGIDADVDARDNAVASRLGKGKGKIWLTGMPVNDPDSQTIRIEGLKIYGHTERAATDLLMQMALSDGVAQKLESGLTENFRKDFDRIITAARKAVSALRIGDFVLAINIREVHHERITATGKGLFLPVVVTGTGSITHQRGR